MKKLFKISLIASGILIANSAFSGVAEYTNVKATCYIFKNNKLLSKKVNCTYSSHTRSMMYGGTSKTFTYFEFKMPDYSTVSIESLHKIERDGNGYDISSNEHHLNSEYAVHYYRNKSLHMIPEPQTKKNGHNILKCYRSDVLNFCFVDR